MAIEMDYGRQALDFIEDVERHATVDSVMDAMVREFGRFGFETLILTGLPNPEQNLEEQMGRDTVLAAVKAWPVLAKRLSPEWCELYTRNQYIRVDPVARLCHRTVNPFEWSEAPYDSENEPRSAEVMQRATDFRMSRGFIVPIHGIAGDEACVSLSGQHLDLNIRSKPAIHLMAMYAFDRVRRLIAPPKAVRKLTARQREVMAWSASGKSAWEIGAIIGITQRTVEEHIAMACRKLGATNRTQAVAVSIREGLIVP
jgi:LuxR family transcriptional regulator, quorum-sensing system regulator BjaR1